ncbi:MAG: hypothetical protein MI784_01765 [Cytophagales bacterium]|nr:hypothetical protein [Cytophagales bacterium]
MKLLKFFFFCLLWLNIQAHGQQARPVLSDSVFLFKIQLVNAGPQDSAAVRSVLEEKKFSYEPYQLELSDEHPGFVVTFNVEEHGVRSFVSNTDKIRYFRSGLRVGKDIPSSDVKKTISENLVNVITKYDELFFSGKYLTVKANYGVSFDEYYRLAVRENRTRKDNIRVAIKGYPSEEILKTLNNAVNELNQLIHFPVFIITTNPKHFNFKHFSLTFSFTDFYPVDGRTTEKMVSFNKQLGIDVPKMLTFYQKNIKEKVLKRMLWQALVKQLGDFNTVSNVSSVFSKDQQTVGLSDYDRRVIEKLYNTPRKKK